MGTTVYAIGVDDVFRKSNFVCVFSDKKEAYDYVEWMGDQYYVEEIEYNPDYNKAIYITFKIEWDDENEWVNSDVSHIDDIFEGYNKFFITESRIVGSKDIKRTYNFHSGYVIAEDKYVEGESEIIVADETKDKVEAIKKYLKFASCYDSDSISNTINKWLQNDYLNKERGVK